MIRRLAAVSALVLAGLAASPAAQAQGFFSFDEASPRDVVDRLYEQGYSVHLPMIRRGDVYVVDAVSSSHRAMRLIVSTRDGHVLQRFATTPRWGDDEPHSARWREEETNRAPDDSEDTRWERHTRTALGDPADLPPRYERDNGFDQRPTPPAPLADDPDKPRHHARKRHDPEPSLASTPPDPRPAQSRSSDSPSAKPTPAPTSQAKVEDKPAPKVLQLDKSAPSNDAKVEAAPTPRQTTVTIIPQAKVEDKPAPRVIPLTRPTPAPTTDAKVEDKSMPKTAEAPAKAPTAQANVDEKPAPKVAKPETPRKKLNDLPVGTLD
jgi:hypothetical protein